MIVKQGLLAKAGFLPSWKRKRNHIRLVCSNFNDTRRYKRRNVAGHSNREDQLSAVFSDRAQCQRFCRVKFLHGRAWKQPKRRPFYGGETSRQFSVILLVDDLLPMICSPSSFRFFSLRNQSSKTRGRFVVFFLIMAQSLVEGNNFEEI